MITTISQYRLIRESIELVEDWDKEYAAYVFYQNSVKYVVLIEEKRYKSTIKHCVRFRKSDSTYDDLSGENVPFTVLSNVCSAILDFKTRCGIKTFYIYPSSVKRMNVFIRLIERKGWICIQTNSNERELEITIP